MAVRSYYVQKGGSFLVFLYKTLEERAHTNDWAFPKETSKQLKLTLNYVIQKTFLFSLQPQKLFLPTHIPVVFLRC